MADADVAPQLEHVMLLEDIAHQAAALAHAQFAFDGSGDAGGILAAMLQHGERVVQPLVDRACADDSDDSAHNAVLTACGRGSTAVLRHLLANDGSQAVGDALAVGHEA